MTDVFNDPNKQTPNSVDSLVGDGKKFKTVEDLAKGKLEADAYIERLTNEMAELRKDLEKRVSVEAEVEAIRKEMLKLQQAPVAPPAKDTTSPQLTVDAIKQLVSQSITDAERNRTASQNVIESNNAVLKAFNGDLAKATEHVSAKSKELGISVADLRDMAARSPSAFQKLVLDQPISTNTDKGAAPPKTTVTPPVNQPGGNFQEGTKEYFDNIRKTDPKRYWQPAMQQRIFEAAKSGSYQL